MLLDMPQDSTCASLLFFYKEWQEAADPKKKAFAYHHFRQGLDILDLDAITYEMLSRNRQLNQPLAAGVVRGGGQAGLF